MKTMKKLDILAKEQGLTIKRTKNEDGKTTAHLPMGFKGTNHALNRLKHERSIRGSKITD